MSFLHADSNKGENIYLGMSRRFNQKVNNGKNKVFKLKNNFYGIIQIPCASWEYMTDKLEDCGSSQSKLYPCFF